MTTSTLDQQKATGFLQEHRDLMRTVTSLRQWSYELAELGIPKYDEMAWRVRELRERLADHFAHEEHGGYLSGPLASAPQCADLAVIHPSLDGGLRDPEGGGEILRAQRAARLLEGTNVLHDLHLLAPPA